MSHQGKLPDNLTHLPEHDTLYTPLEPHSGMQRLMLWYSQRSLSGVSISRILVISTSSHAPPHRIFSPAPVPLMLLRITFQLREFVLSFL
jgi:hypothetical protein